VELVLFLCPKDEINVPMAIGAIQLRG
jgi:hypothetical protein